MILSFQRSVEAGMSRETLFDDLPEAEPAAREWPGQPRLREPVRDQVELRTVDLEALLAAEHPARVIRGKHRSARACNWRCGCLPQARVSGVVGRWLGCAKAMMPIAGCAAG